MLNGTKHIPAKPDKFEFDPEVAAVFDNMAVRSLPQYIDVMDFIGNFTGHWAPADGTQVWDFGCSTGTGLEAVYSRAPTPLLDYFGVDTSREMLTQMMRKVPVATPIVHDLTKGLPREWRAGRVSVALVNWTLQFIEDKDYRRKLLKEIYDGLAPGGFMVVCEKFSLEDETHDWLAQFQYLWWRRINGYTTEEIMAKTAALKNSMWPWSPRDLEAALPESAFWLFKQFNFGGMVARKPKA